MARVVRAKYEDGVLKPLEKLDLEEGEEVVVKVIRRGLAKKVFGSLKISFEELRRLIKESEDEFGVY